MKLFLDSYMAEFVTIYDEDNKEMVDFQSDEIKSLEDSLEKLLEHLNIEYEWKNKHN